MNKIINFNKSDLVFSISKKMSISESTTIERIDHLLNEIINNVALDKNIEVRGFGVFSKKYIRPRQFINPKTKNVSYLGETSTLHFKPSQKLLSAND